MSSIKSRYIWILIVLVTAIISPVRGHTSVNGNETRYTYNAAGQKLRVVHNTAKPNITNAFGVEPAGLTSTQILNFDVTDYLLGGSLVVQNNMTKMLLFDGGYAKAERINPTAYGYTLFYYNQDYLGNIREVMNASGYLQQKTNYYPFGGIIADLCSEQDIQPYKYNGKELDLMHGLNTYDYGARQYDPILCRWDRVDWLCEKKPWQSPYTYGRNNPLRFIDPDGNDELDKAMGYLIGAATNIIPFTGAARDLYSPIDASDYNTALKTTDNTFIAIGDGMTDAGKGGVAIGTAVAATGGAIVVGSGGTAAVAGASTAVAGATLVGVSAATGLAGTLMQMNAVNNKSGGYERGKSDRPKGTPVNSKTLWNSKGKDNARIDVENPKGRSGQIHLHIGNKKYFYNSKEKSFTDAPQKVNELLKRGDVQGAIKKGLKYLGE